jgi:hypothetical protein
MAETMRIRSPWPLALVSGAIVFARLALLNLDGYHNEPFGPGDFLGEPPNINWTHGWPFVCMGRTSVGTGPLVVAKVQTTITSRWPFDDTPVHYLYPGRLGADIAILFMSVLGTVWSINSLMRRPIRRLRYGLKFLFVVMTLTAAVLAMGPNWADRLIQYRFTMIVLILAAMATIWATLDALARMARRPMPARQV